MRKVLLPALVVVPFAITVWIAVFSHQYKDSWASDDQIHSALDPVLKTWKPRPYHARSTLYDDFIKVATDGALASRWSNPPTQAEVDVCEPSFREFVGLPIEELVLPSPPTLSYGRDFMKVRSFNENLAYRCRFYVLARDSERVAESLIQMQRLQNCLAQDWPRHHFWSSFYDSLDKAITAGLVGPRSALQMLTKLPDEQELISQAKSVALDHFWDRSMPRLLWPDRAGTRTRTSAGSYYQLETVRAVSSVAARTIGGLDPPIGDKLESYQREMGQIYGAHGGALPYQDNFPDEGIATDIARDASEARYASGMQGIPNSRGKQVILSAEREFETLLIRNYDRVTDLAGAKTRLALIVFNGRFGRLPERLTELVSTGCLKAVPIDPNTNRAVGWSTARKKVYAGRPDRLWEWSVP